MVVETLAWPSNSWGRCAQCDDRCDRVTVASSPRRKRWVLQTLGDAERDFGIDLEKLRAAVSLAAERFRGFEARADGSRS